jgi:1-acyl-sn-glycerol-3-phosphate acyltransferase
MPCSVTGCNHLIISNHLSYLDVIVIAAHFPTLFVTSIDLPASSLLLRLVARAAGCIFVDRVKATTLLRDIKEISILLASGYNVTFFPEATTSATGRVLPFKSALFTCSAHSGVDVLALALRYPNLENKDEVYFHSGAQLVPHLSKLLWQGRNIEVEVLVCGFYRMVGDRKQFAREMRDVIGGCV